MRLLIVLLILLAACQSEAEPPPTEAAPQVFIRQLVTVAPTFTPEATAAGAVAVRPTPTRLPPTPTPYVGVFIGEAIDDSPLDVFTILPTRQPGISLVCEIPAAEVFGTRWQAEVRAASGLRCPIQESFGFTGRVQVFEDGVMYANLETNQIWAIAPAALLDGITAEENGSVWYIDSPPPISTTGLDAPPGLRVPEGTFASGWVTVPQAREAIGFAITTEEEVAINIQRFEGGTLFLDATVGQVFVLMVNGDAYGPYDT